MIGNQTLPCSVTTAKCLSEVPLPEKCAVVFDLDDTLYRERDFVESGFRAVADYIDQRNRDSIYDNLIGWYEAGETDVFARIIEEKELAINKATLIRKYRKHEPTLKLASEVKQLLKKLRTDGHDFGIITDGRAETQRNKIRALGLDQWNAAIAISEEMGVGKPHPKSFLRLQHRFFGMPLVYVGDNPAKDFLAPRRLGWTTVCVRASDANIHPQKFEGLRPEYLPHYLIDELAWS